MPEPTQFNFGEGVGTSFSNGMLVGQNAQKLKLEKEQANREAVKQKYEQMMGLADKGITYFTNKSLPPEMRMEYMNKLTVPALKQLGIPVADVTSIDNPEQEKIFDKATEMFQQWRKGEIDFQTFKWGVGIYGQKLKQLGASENTLDTLVNQMQPKATINTFPSGPGGKQTTQAFDESGKPVGAPIGEGTPKESGTDQRSKLEGFIKADENDLLKLVRSKDGLPNVEGGLMRKLFNSAPSWDDFNDKDKAQIALLQSKVQRLKANLTSVNPLRTEAGIEPIDFQPEILEIADKLSKIKGLPTAPKAGTEKPVTVNSQAEYDKLTPGAAFIDSTGKVAYKGGKKK